MKHQPFSGGFLRAFALTLVTAVVLSACTISVKKDKDGDDKNVDIRTPVADLHVSKGADASDTGLPVYPGARRVEKDDDGDQHSANVNISTGFFGLKVIAVEFQSDDSSAKLIAFYKDKLKKYGDVLECHTSGKGVHTDDDDKDSDKLTCDESGGQNIELKVGTSDNQHMVGIEPQAKGTKFALVLVQKHGKDTI
jgi:hypothetical protein